MSHQGQRPSIEFTRRGRDGSTRSYGHVYWHPFIVHVWGRTIIGKKRLRRQWADVEAVAEGTEAPLPGGGTNGD